MSTPITVPGGGTAPTSDTMWAKLLDLQNRMNNVAGVLTPQVVYLASNQVINSTSAAAVLSQPVNAAAYLVRGKLTWVQGNIQAQQSLRFTGPTLGSMGISVWESYVAGTAGESVIVTNINAYNTDVNGFGASGIPANAASFWRFDGVAVFSAAGTFTVQARCVTSGSDNYTVFAPYSFLEMTQIT